MNTEKILDKILKKVWSKNTKILYKPTGEVGKIKKIAAYNTIGISACNQYDIQLDNGKLIKNVYQRDLEKR